MRRVALGLAALGIQRGDRVAILSENRPEWAIADFACLTSGVTDVPLYPSLPAEQLAYLLRDSGAVAIFVSTAAQAAKIAAIRAELPGAQDGHRLRRVGREARGHDARGARAERRRRRIAGARGRVHARKRCRVQPDDLATIIYTSGTTGEPKGVMLSHDNIYSNVAATRNALVMRGDDVSLSFLPLSHIFERMAATTGSSRRARRIAYAESFDLVPLAHVARCGRRIAISVPRLYEKMYARVLENALAGRRAQEADLLLGARRRRSVGRREARRPRAGRLARAAVRASRRSSCSRSCKARTGGRLRYFVSGGAPLAPEINKFFYAAGLVILEGYGLTETSPVIAVNTPENFRIGTVGKPIDGVEVKIADDGEILTRGPHVMKGYYNKPDATREAIDADGWFHTGDIGVHRGRVPSRSPIGRRTSSSPPAARTSRRSRSRTRSRRTSTSARR